MDQPFPPALPTSSTKSEHADQTHAIWVAALALPLVIVVSGAVVAFLCWRRLRVDPTHWKQIFDSPPSSSQDHAPVRDAHPPSTRPFPRPLVLLARTASVPSPRDPALYRSQCTTSRSQPAASSSTFPSVSTRISPSGTRVLTKKNGPTSGNWPPPISWPLELETLNASNRAPGEDGARAAIEGGGGGRQSRANSGANEVNLHRGLSLVSGYQSQSIHHDPHQLRQLVEEAQATRTSWTEGDDELDHRLSRPRAKSLSSQSLSNYSHMTMGATTLGNLIDQEVARVAAHTRDDQRSVRSTVPSLSPVTTTRPLEIVRPRSSADLYSLRPVSSHVPFPRLAPISLGHSRSSSHPDLPTTPSTYYISGTARGDAEAWFPPPLPYDHDARFYTSSSRPPAPCSTAPLDVPVPLPSDGVRSHPTTTTTTTTTTYLRSDPLPLDSGSSRLLGEPGVRVENLVEWTRGKRRLRERERQDVNKQMDEW